MGPEIVETTPTIEPQSANAAAQEPPGYGVYGESNDTLKLKLYSGGHREMLISQSPYCYPANWQPFKETFDWTDPRKGEVDMGVRFRTDAKETECFTMRYRKGLFATLPHNLVSFNQLPKLSFQSVVTQGKTIVVNTGYGLSVSQDGGRSWTNRTTLNGLRSNVVKNIVEYDSKLLAYAVDRIDVSSDGGLSWSKFKDAPVKTGKKIFAVGGKLTFLDDQDHFHVAKDQNAEFLRIAGLDGAGIDVFEFDGKVVFNESRGLSYLSEDGLSATRITLLDNLSSKDVSSLKKVGTKVLAATGKGVFVKY